MVGLFRVGYEKINQKKSRRWQWFTFRAHKDTSLHYVLRVGWLLTEKAILGLNYHTEIRVSSDVSSKRRWLLVRFLDCFLQSLIPYVEFPRLSPSCTVFPNTSRPANYTQMWYQIRLFHSNSVWNCWEQQQVGRAAGKLRSLHTAGHECFPASMRGTRIQLPWREAKSFSQRGLKEAGVRFSRCSLSC